MFCSFDKKAEIARRYGRGAVIRPDHARWPELIANFAKFPGVRQVMGDPRRIGDDFIR